MLLKSRTQLTDIGARLLSRFRVAKPFDFIKLVTVFTLKRHKCRAPIASLAVLMTALSSTAEPATDVEKTRSLAMKEAIQLALKNNLDIRISQSTPLLDQYGLNGLYGAYDPGFSFGARYDFNSSFGGLDQQGRPFSQNTSEAEAYSSGISGVLPTGTSYQLGGTLSKDTTYSPTFVPLTLTNGVVVQTK